MHEFIKRVYDVELTYPEFDLRNYQKILEHFGLEWNMDSLKNADVSKLDLQGIIAVMLAAIRGDRFCEGALLGFFKDSSIDKWLGRLENFLSNSSGRTEMADQKISIVNQGITC